jgi:hypothetical protein
VISEFCHCSVLLRLLTTTTTVGPSGLALPQPAATLFFAPVQTKAWYTSLARHLHGCHGLPARVENNRISQSPVLNASHPVMDPPRRSSWLVSTVTPDVLLAAAYESPSTVDYRIRRAESPLIATDAESEADILGRQTTKTWVNNTVKESSVTSHVRIRRQRIYTNDNRRLYHGSLNCPHTILRRSDIAQDIMTS